MAKLTFFPLGNADCCRIDLDGDKKVLFDYANVRCPDDDDDKRCDLEQELRDDLEAADRDYYDVVACASGAKTTTSTSTSGNTSSRMLASLPPSSTRTRMVSSSLSTLHSPSGSTKTRLRIATKTRSSCMRRSSAKMLRRASS